MLLSSQQLAWETPGVCPSCGAITDHHWFSEVLAHTYDPQLARGISHELEGNQGKLLVSVCMSEQCQATEAAGHRLDQEQERGVG